MSDYLENSPRLSRDDWSTYWRKGTLTTFQGQFAQNYDGSIKDFWEDIFTGCTDEANVVDLATGNGALAILIAEICRGKNLSVTAIDYAQIRADEFADGDQSAIKIDFLSDVPVECTGLSSQKFDYAVSQFGFEYADTEKAIAELDRILKRDGAMFAAIMHHKNSVLLKYAHDSLEQIKLCENSALIKITRDLLTRIDTLRNRNINPQKDERCESLRNQFNISAQSLLDISEKFADKGHIEFFLDNLSANFRKRELGASGLTTQLESLLFIESETNAFRARMEDLCSAALEEAKIERLKKQLEEIGLKIENCAPLYYDNKLFAWKLVARREII